MAQLESPGSSVRELPTEAAFRATLPEMAALGETGLSPINVDVVSAVTTVLGCLAALRELRPDIQRHLPTFDLERFDKLEQYTLALNQAHAIHRGTLAGRGSIAELGGEVAELRDRLLDDAESLANHGVFSAERLKECKKSPSYRAIATDVFTLLAIFKEHWPKVENRSPVTAGFLEQAGSRALDLLAAVGVKEQAPSTVGEAQLVRQQAFTLFFKAYGDARGAIEYLRREQGDASRIIPTFYVGRAGNRTNVAPDADASADAPVEDDEPTAPSGSAADPAPTISISNPHNLPIDSPFVA